MISPWRWVLVGCALALACGDPGADVVHEGVYVDFEFDLALEPCGDVVEHMDRYVELSAAYLGIALEGHRFTFRWFTPEGYQVESGCPEGSFGCAGGSVAHSQAAPHDHELAHLVSRIPAAPGRRPSFFVEGLAVALALPDYLSRDNQAVGATEVLDHIVAEKTAAEIYPLAGLFTSFVLDRYGVAAFMQFYVDVGGAVELPEIEAVFHDSFGEELVAVIADFDAEGRDCGIGRARVKLRECADEPIAWDGEVMTLSRSLACDDSDVVGPFGDATARTWVKVEITEAGLHDLTVAGVGGSAAATFASCGGCDDSVHERLRAGETQRLWLPAGAYYVQLEGSASETTSIAVRLARHGVDSK